MKKWKRERKRVKKRRGKMRTRLMPSESPLSGLLLKHQHGSDPCLRHGAPAVKPKFRLSPKSPDLEEMKPPKRALSPLQPPNLLPQSQTFVRRRHFFLTLKKRMKSLLPQKLPLSLLKKTLLPLELLLP